ncbi:INO80 complex subunit E-like [Physella acuta]|uniref:INO80 complex subunit E-like n=1 Tax=Physella acuta TaxID=109671 RepID=UPI0027DC63FF|nr:INO80 complex subunit E-like [Physella acuta]XP_059143300.1 INO80 complex subunit E-like [Physella acuta]XP_059143301.1 INO80 complex subunit E-like [Physella acuta]XP_059143302.1 INO80 complex subunit E-like [Physella acuta]
MMPVTGEFEEEFPEGHIDYRQKYKALKKKMRLLVYEQECFLDELRKAQRKLLKVSRDRSFLLDRLLQQEKVEDSSGESDATNSTDTEDGGQPGPVKKRRLVNQPSSAAELAQMMQSSAKHITGGDTHVTKKKSKSSGKKSSKSNSQKSAAVKLESPGQMTREELERHLESKRHEFGIEKATASLPMEIFSNDPNQESDPGADGGEEDEDDLVIDVPH